MGKPSDKIMRVMRALDINDEEISKRLGQYTEDVEYFYQKYEGLRRRFPDQFVAVYGKRIVGHGKNISRLVRQLEKDGYDTGSVFIQFAYLRTRMPKFILYSQAA
jgi:hypothetical protein